MNAQNQFYQTYEIQDAELFSSLYDIDELILFLPSQPTQAEKKALQQISGVQGVTYGYIDWIKSNNTFELIMQWRERTGNL